jgi:hypothetical protein
MKLKYFAFACLATLSLTTAFGQNTADNSTQTLKKKAPFHRFSISTPYLSLINFVPPSIDMYELHVDYRITPKDQIGVKAVTWSLFEPMGIPWGPDKMNETENYPGRVRETGVGITYQRLLWKGLFAAVEILPLHRTFLNENHKKVDTGFRLYTSYHVGYHIPLFRNRMFLEPQIHCNYWPVDSKGPAGFAGMENKWNNYFLFEPNLYIGINF